jgi:hypothetical protein
VDSISRRLNVIRPTAGRPLSAGMAWALLWQASGLRPAWVSSAELSRVRRYLRDRSPKDWPRLLGNRAEIHRVRMLPTAVKRLRNQRGVSAGGISAAGHYGLDLMPMGDESAFYVDANVLLHLASTQRITLDAERPNVVLRVPTLARPELLEKPVVPPAVVAADLLDDGDERGGHAALRLLATMRTNGE